MRARARLAATRLLRTEFEDRSGTKVELFRQPGSKRRIVWGAPVKNRSDQLGAIEGLGPRRDKLKEPRGQGGHRSASP